jgi:hypothetical protein
LTSSPHASKLASTEVNFTPNTEAQFKEFAARKGKDAAQVEDISHPTGFSNRNYAKLCTRSTQYGNAEDRNP